MVSSFQMPPLKTLILSCVLVTALGLIFAPQLQAQSIGPDFPSGGGGSGATTATGLFVHPTNISHSFGVGATTIGAAPFNVTTAGAVTGLSFNAVGGTGVSGQLVLDEDEALAGSESFTLRVDPLGLTADQDCVISDTGISGTNCLIGTGSGTEKMFFTLSANSNTFDQPNCMDTNAWVSNTAGGNEGSFAFPTAGPSGGTTIEFTQTGYYYVILTVAMTVDYVDAGDTAELSMTTESILFGSRIALGDFLAGTARQNIISLTAQGVVDITSIPDRIYLCAQTVPGPATDEQPVIIYQTGTFMTVERLGDT